MTVRKKFRVKEWIEIIGKNAKARDSMKLIRIRY